MTNFVRKLDDAHRCEPQAEELFPPVYNELRRFTELGVSCEPDHVNKPLE